jgi:hypothetical protein
MQRPGPVSENGPTVLRMADAQLCRVRLVAFGGHRLAREHGVLTISIGHCISTIELRSREGRDVLSGAQFKDPVLGVVALMTKLDELESHNNLERLDGQLRN